MPQVLSAGLKRFAKGFVAGGLSSVMLIIGAGFQFHNLADFRTWLTSLVFAFLTGGLLAVEKMYNYIPQPPQEPVKDGQW